MRVKVSKLMADTIRKKCKAAGLKYSVTLEKLTIDQFTTSVGNSTFQHEEDYDSETNRLKVIKVVYPYDYYACPQYLTSSDLRILYSNSDKTYDGFFGEILKWIEV